MSSNRDPWVTTDARIPYLVFPIDLPPAFSASDVAHALDGVMQPVSDIYNCKAYSLSKESDAVFCTRGSTECAILVFINSSAKVDLSVAGSRADPIYGLVSRALARINDLVSEKGTLQISKVGPLEISKKTSN